MSMACKYNPTHDEGGMFHCPECGEMILAGMPHPDYSLLGDDMEEIEAPIDPPDDWWEEDAGDKEFGGHFDDADDLRDIERDEELLRDE